MWGSGWVCGLYLEERPEHFNIAKNAVMVGTDPRKQLLVVRQNVVLRGEGEMSLYSPRSSSIRGGGGGNADATMTFKAGGQGVERKLRKAGDEVTS